MLLHDHRFLPALEALEDRCLPSVLLVSNLKDAGAGSLRRAIAKANATAAPDVIEFAPMLKGTIKLKSGELKVTRDLNIKGPGLNKLVLSGADISRIFDVESNATLRLSNLSIRNGNAGTGDGGAVQNHGRLILDKLLLAENHAGGDGGAVANVDATATLKISRSKLVNNSAGGGGAVANLDGVARIAGAVITNNTAANQAGGILNLGFLAISTSTISQNSGSFAGGLNNASGAVAIVRGCTLNGNVSRFFAGGLFSNGAALTVINSTIVNNISLGSVGGGIVVASTSGSLTLLNSTITGNVDATDAPNGAGGIVFLGGLFTLHNTVIADNFAPLGGTPNISGTVDGGKGNFIGIGTAALTGISNGVDGNQIGTTATPLDPKLGPLEPNGGPTLTRLPRPGSPLINKGVSNVLPSWLTSDQRGFTRRMNASVDVGAVEFGATGAPAR